MKLDLRHATDDQSWRTGTSPLRSKSFSSAKRHSRWVRLLRTMIPAGIGVLVVGYALFTYFNPFGALPGVASLSSMVISGTRVTMDLPKLAGYTRDGRQYELIAAAATQDLKKPALIELKDINAKVEMRSGSSVNVKASAGLYDTKAETVMMRDNVRVSTTTGTEVFLREAMIDIRKGHVISQQPVEVQLSNGRVEAQGLEVTDSGAVLNFTGGVSVVMNADVPLASAGTPR